MKSNSGIRKPVSAPKSAITPNIAEPEQGAAKREYPKPTKNTLFKFEGVEG